MSPPDWIAQVHFAGGAAIAADTNAAAFTNLWCTPEAQALRSQTLDMLARAPYAWLKSKMAATNDGAAQLRPLLEDGLAGEWFLQIRDATNGSPESVLAIHLPADRARSWQTSLAAVLESWTGITAEKTATGWTLKKHQPPDLIRFARAGDWVVLGCGQGDLPLTGELVRRVSAGQRPGPFDTNAWFSAEVDWPRLARRFPELQLPNLPETRCEAVGRGGNLRLAGKLVFPQPLAWTLEPWQLPTNAIHMPINGFAAWRGLAPWLRQQAWLQPYALTPWPNQMIIWSMVQMPLQTFAAVPVPDGKKALQELEEKLSARTNWRGEFAMPLTMVPTNNEIFWRGLPMVAPSLQTLHEPGGDFLFASVFPNTPSGRPLPPDLLAQLAPANLVYYHWEITGERLKQLPQLTQLALMITRHRQLDVRSAAGKWLERIGPTLGATVTEVKQTATNELSFQRKAPAGLTAVELIALASWLEATNFPGCNLDLPPPRRRHPAAPATNAPPAQIPAASP